MGLRIAFLRPRLGLGGAERLIVDAAHELIGKGHDVSFHVPAAAGGPQFEDVPAAMPFYRDGAWLPEHVGGRLHLPCAIARTRAAARGLVSIRPDYHIVICDVVPHVLPWLKRRTSARLVYFGHFPEARHARAPRRGWRRTYLGPLERWESHGIAAADAVLVNSRFTMSAFRDNFPELASIPLTVLHPGITVLPPGRSEGLDHHGRAGDSGSVRHDAHLGIANDAIVLLSLGRFGRRENLPLAIRALDALRTRMAPETFPRVRLVFVGRFDARRGDVRDVHAELEREAREKNLHAQIVFVESTSAAEQAAWLERALVVVYTPEAEQFGIVPLEAMAAGRPVVAVDRGAPLETVVVGRTGLLCEPHADAFAAAIARFINEPDLARRMGTEGRAHVQERFTRERFGDQLDAIVRQLAGGRTKASPAGSKKRTAAVPKKAEDTPVE